MPPTCLRRPVLTSVAELLIPVGSAAFGGEVEQVPQRLDGADMAGVLPGIGGCVKQLGTPEVANRIPVAVEDVQHRLLVAVWGLGEVVPVIGGACGGQHPEPPPA